MSSKVLTPQYLRKLELLKLRARKQFLGLRQGAHRSLKRGHGIEFFDYRKYELGDNPRHIDWSLYARSERLYIKRFQEEQDLSLLIILDGSSSMFTPASSGKWEFAVNLALSLAYIAFFQQDRVALTVPGAVLTPFMSGPKAIYDIEKQLSTINSVKTNNFIGELRKAVASVKQPGMAIFISDYLFPLSFIHEATSSILAKNLDTTFIQVLSSEDLDPLKQHTNVRVVDSETEDNYDIQLTPELREKYHQLFKEHQNQLFNFFQNRRLAAVSTKSSIKLEEFISTELGNLGIVQ